jgi:hypothetical protein
MHTCKIRLVAVFLSIWVTNVLSACYAPSVLAFRGNHATQAFEKLRALADRLDLAVCDDSCANSIEISLKNAEGDRVAYVQGSCHDTQGKLNFLQVTSPLLRRKGIASLLWHTFYEACLVRGCEKIEWYASSFGDHPIPHDQLIAFYTRLGGRVVHNHFMECQIVPRNDFQVQQYRDARDLLMQKKQEQEMALEMHKEHDIQQELYEQRMQKKIAASISYPKMLAAFKSRQYDQYSRIISQRLLLDLPIAPFITSKL